MTKLKLVPLADDKLVKISIDLPARVHRDLIVYAEHLGRTTGQSAPDPAKLIAPIARLMATDRAFAKARQNPTQPGANPRDLDSALGRYRERVATKDCSSLGQYARKCSDQYKTIGFAQPLPWRRSSLARIAQL